MRSKKSDGFFNIRTMPGDKANIKAAAIKLSNQTGEKPQMTKAIKYAVKLFLTNEKAVK